MVVVSYDDVLIGLLDDPFLGFLDIFCHLVFPLHLFYILVVVLRFISILLRMNLYFTATFATHFDIKVIAPADILLRVVL